MIFTIRTLGGRISAAPIRALALAFLPKSIVISSHSFIGHRSASSFGSPFASTVLLKAKARESVQRSRPSNSRRLPAVAPSNPFSLRTSRAFAAHAELSLRQLSAVRSCACCKRFFFRFVARIDSRVIRFSFQDCIFSFSCKSCNSVFVEKTSFAKSSCDFVASLRISHAQEIFSDNRSIIPFSFGSAINVVISTILSYFSSEYKNRSVFLEAIMLTITKSITP